MPKEWLYHFAVAFFHSRPQRGVPGGTGRVAIGRPLERPAEIQAPPKKPRPAWSKLSPLKSSMFMPCEAPAAMNGLISLSSKNTPTPLPLTW